MSVVVLRRGLGALAAVKQLRAKIEQLGEILMLMCFLEKGAKCSVNKSEHHT